MSFLACSLGLFSWFAFLVHSVQSHLVLQSSSLGPLSVVEACVSVFLFQSSLCSRRMCFRIPLRLQKCSLVWHQDGTCCFQGPMNGIRVLGQPTSRKCSCWLCRTGQAGGAGAWVFTPLWRALRVGCPDGWLIPYLLVLYVLQPAVFQSSTEVSRGQVSLQVEQNLQIAGFSEEGYVLGKPTCRKLSSKIHPFHQSIVLHIYCGIIFAITVPTIVFKP